MSNSWPVSLIFLWRSHENPERAIRDRDHLVAAKDILMNPRILEVIAKSSFETVFVRDKGMMLGDGEVWITHDQTGFGLGAITLK